MERIAVIAQLRPGTEEQAKQLLAAGPPFDPASLGLTSHDVYLGHGPSSSRSKARRSSAACPTS